MAVQNPVVTITNLNHQTLATPMASASLGTEVRARQAEGAMTHGGGDGGGVGEQQKKVCEHGNRPAEASQPTNSDTENSTNSTWSSLQSSRANSKRLEAGQRLNLILPQEQAGCLSTPVIVTSDQISSGNQLSASCATNPFAQNGSSQLLFDSLAHLNGQGEVSLFTGLPSCTPASADRLAASGINPFFWNTSTTGANHLSVQSCDQAGATQNGARQAGGQQDHQCGPTREAPATQSKQRNQHNQQQQQQLPAGDPGGPPAGDHEQQQRTKLMIANLQAASALSPLILSPLSLLGLSPEQEAWLRFGYVSPNQHPLAGKNYTQADLDQLQHHGHHPFNMYAQQMSNVQSQCQQQQQQQQQQHPQQHPHPQQQELQSQQAAQDLTSASGSGHSTMSAVGEQAAAQQPFAHHTPMGHHQWYQQELQPYSRAAYYAGPAQDASNITQYQQQQQQQNFFQSRGAQARQLGGKTPLPTFQISGASQTNNNNCRQTITSGHLDQSATQQRAPPAGRVGSPAQSHFIHHQGPQRYAPTSTQVMGVAPGMAASATNHHQQGLQVSTPSGGQVQPDPRQRPLSRQVPAQFFIMHNQQQQQQTTLISTNNVIQGDVRPIGVERVASNGQHQPATLARQEGLPLMPTHQKSGQHQGYMPIQQPARQQPMIDSSEPQANSLRANLSVETRLQVPNGTVSPMSSDNDNGSITTTTTTTTSRSSPQSDLRTSSISPSSSSLSNAHQSESSQHDGPPVGLSAHSGIVARDQQQAASINKSAKTASRSKVKQKKTKKKTTTTTTTTNGKSKLSTADSQTMATTVMPTGNQESRAGKVAMTTDENGEPVPVKKKSRGGRKKKLVTHEEMVARKNRSKERNRVAARRCRQKRKQFLDELRDKIDGLNNLNQKLQRENSALKSELSRLKEHQRACNA